MRGKRKKITPMPTVHEEYGMHESKRNGALNEGSEDESKATGSTVTHVAGGEEEEWILVDAKKTLYRDHADPSSRSQFTVTFRNIQTGEEQACVYAADPKPTVIINPSRPAKDRRRRYMKFGGSAIVKDLRLLDQTQANTFPKVLALKSVLPHKNKDYENMLRRQAVGNNTSMDYMQAFGVPAFMSKRRQAGREGGGQRIYAVMGSIGDGEDLSLHLDKPGSTLLSGPTTLDDINKAFSRLLARIHFFHQKEGRAVLDIKPENMMPVFDNTGRLVDLMPIDLDGSFGNDIVHTSAYMLKKDLNLLYSRYGSAWCTVDEGSKVIDTGTLGVVYALLLRYMNLDQHVDLVNDRVVGRTGRHWCLNITCDGDDSPTMRRVTALRDRRNCGLDGMIKLFGGECEAVFKAEYQRCQQRYNAVKKSRLQTSITANLIAIEEQVAALGADISLIDYKQKVETAQRLLSYIGVDLRNIKPLCGGGDCYGEWVGSYEAVSYQMSLHVCTLKRRLTQINKKVKCSFAHMNNAFDTFISAQSIEDKVNAFSVFVAKMNLIDDEADDEIKAWQNYASYCELKRDFCSRVHHYVHSLLRSFSRDDRRDMGFHRARNHQKNMRSVCEYIAEILFSRFYMDATDCSLHEQFAHIIHGLGANNSFVDALHGFLMQAIEAYKTLRSEPKFFDGRFFGRGYSHETKQAAVAYLLSRLSLNLNQPPDDFSTFTFNYAGKEYVIEDLEEALSQGKLKDFLVKAVKSALKVAHQATIPRRFDIDESSSDEAVMVKLIAYCCDVSPQQMHTMRRTDVLFHTSAYGW